MSDVQVSIDKEASRYEAHLEGELAGYAEYRVDGDVVEFHHTVTDPKFGGRGVASALARRSLEDARDQGRTVLPTCSFYQGWIDKHPDYADLVD